MPKLQQVFIGCPFAKAVRAPFDRLKRDIEASSPLHIVLADTVGVTSSDYLLDHITELISESAGCVFDVTGANPNVSLEVGIAHTVPVDFVLVFKTRKARKKNIHEDAATVKSIISDLQGKNRIEYKTYESLKKQLESRYFANLPYMKRWRTFKEENAALARYTLPLFQDLRSSGRSQMSRLAAMVEGSGIAASYAVGALTKYRLIAAQRGRNGGLFFPQK